MKKTRGLLKTLLHIALAAFFGAALYSVSTFSASAADVYWTAAAGYDSGDGLTEETAFTICTPEQLAFLSESVRGGNDYAGKYFKLASNINLSSKLLKPIGDYQADASSKPFNGTFEGQGNSVTGFLFDKINPLDAATDPGEFCGGFFGYIGAGGTVKNLSVYGTANAYVVAGGIAAAVDGTIDGCNFYGSVATRKSIDPWGKSGGIAGLASAGSVITNCRNFARVTAISSMAGGIAGDSYGTISACANYGLIDEPRKSGNAGGIAGRTNALIQDCYNYGKIVSEHWAGGITGWLTANGRVQNVYNACTVDGLSISGGIIGKNQGCLVNSYSVGKVLASEPGATGGIGGITGVTEGNYTTTGEFNSYYDMSVSGSQAVGAVNGADAAAANTIGLNIDNMRGAAAFTQMVFASVTTPASYTAASSWTTTIGLPMLKRNPEYGADAFTSGYGSSASDPFRIKNVAMLNSLAYGVNAGNKYAGAHFKLDAYLNLPAVAAGESNFGAIGTINNAFAGTFDGGSNCIDGLIIDRPQDVYSGLFGYVKGTLQMPAVIKNLGLTGGKVRADSSVGGIAGLAEGNITIKNCFNSNEIIGANYHTGGIVGWTDGIVSDCFNTGKVTGYNYTGGIAAYTNGSIERCYNAGVVEGRNAYTGGIAGYIDTAAALTDCYNRGAVAGGSLTGGIIGKNNGALAENLYALYFDSTVMQKYVPSSGLTTADYAIGDTGTNGTNLPDSEVIGLTTDQMTGMDALDYMEFANVDGMIWDCNASTTPDGDPLNRFVYYPYLISFMLQNHLRDAAVQSTKSYVPKNTGYVTFTQAGCSFGQTLPDPVITSQTPASNAEVMYKPGAQIDGGVYVFAKPENAGTYTVRVRVFDTGDYTEAAAFKEIVIAPAALSEIDFGGSATLSNGGSQVYSGAALEPALTVYDSKHTPGVTFTIRYENNVNVGQAKAIIVGKGNYSGELTRYFGITPASPNSKITNEAWDTEATYTGEPLRIEITFDSELVKDVDYTILYEQNTNVTGKLFNDQARIIIRGINNYQGDIIYLFEILPKPLTNELSAVAGSFSYNGAPKVPVPAVTGLTAADYDVSYSNNTNAGTATLTITGKGNYCGTLSANFVIAKRQITITAAAVNLTYGDAPVTQFDYQVSGGTIIDGHTAAGSLACTPGTDAGVYPITQGTLSYGDNYEITFVGSAYTIAQKAISGSLAAVTDTYYYRNAPIKPTPIATLDRSPTLGTDYEYVYENNIHAGSASVSVRGKGNYTGMITQAFTILPAEIIVSPVDAQVKVFGAADPVLEYIITGLLHGEDAFSGKLSRTAGENIGTYEITLGDLSLSDDYSLSLSFFKIYFTINKLQIVVTPKAGQYKYYGDTDPEFTYDITSGTLQGDDKIEGKLSRLGTNAVGEHLITDGTLSIASTNYILTLNAVYFDIKPRPVHVTPDAGQSKIFGASDPAQFTYTLSTTLVGSDFITGTLTRNPGENRGAYKITAGGISLSSNYTLTVDETVDFEITARPLSNEFTAITGGPFYYTGFAQTPAAEVDALLIKGTDYNVTYNDNINAGEASVNVYGTGNYSGILTRKFTIQQKTLSDELQAVSGTFTYDGTEQKPAPTVTGLTASDYDITYTDNVNQGTATLKVTGKGNYKGSLSVNFTISKRAVTVTPEASGKVFGDDEPVIAYTLTSGTLVNGDSFTGILSRAGSENAGSYDIEIGTLTLGNNYTLTLGGSVKFVIAQKALSDELGEVTGSFVYNGSAHTPIVTVSRLTPVDYTLQYSNNINAGTAAVSITGKGNYKGTLSRSFAISKASQDALNVVHPTGLKAGGRAAALNTTGGSGDGDITYVQLSGTDAAEIASDGTVTIKGEGIVTVKAVKAGSVNYLEAESAEITFTIAAADPDGNEPEKPGCGSYASIGSESGGGGLLIVAGLILFVLIRRRKRAQRA